MKNIVYQVDAFTGEPFKGNPAGVYISREAHSERWMRSLAREMNLSETAFLVPQKDGFLLRWFTPAVEVDLCGHATLASAHILWEAGLLKPEETVKFHTRSGLLTASRTPDDWISLDFPAKQVLSVEVPDGLFEGLQIDSARFVGSNKMDYLVELEDEEQVRGLKPDFTQLCKIDIRGVIVTARSKTTGFDFISRFFAPGAGVDEDPVTGSAHTALTPFWASKLGKKEMVAYQASARGGILRVFDCGERVEIHGQAVTVFTGKLSAAVISE